MKVRITYELEESFVAIVPDADYHKLKDYYGADKAGLANALTDYQDGGEHEYKHVKTKSVKVVKDA